MARTYYVKIFTNASADPKDAATKTNTEVENFLHDGDFSTFLVRETSLRDLHFPTGHGTSDTLFIATVIIEATQDTKEPVHG